MSKLYPVAAALIALVLVTGASAETPVRVFETSGDVDDAFSGSGFVGFELNRGQSTDAYDLFLLDSADNVVRVNRPGTEGYAGGIDGTTVIYVEWNRYAGSKLVRYDTATGARADLLVASNPKNPSISGSWVLYEDGSRDKTSNVRLYNLVTGERRRLAFATGHGQYVYSGQVAGDWAAWGRVGEFSNDVYLTSIPSGQTVKLPRPRGVFVQYDPAVTPAGTVYFARGRPCLRRHCPGGDTPKGRNQIVEERLGAHARVVVDMPRGADVNDLYAEVAGAQVRLLFPRFTWLRHRYWTYADLFQVTVPAQ